VGFTASLFTELHMYLTNTIIASDIYTNGLQLGYDYQNNSDVVSLINQLTGRNDIAGPEKFEKRLGNGEYSYKYYYWTHRLGNSDYWYNAGQILDTHVSAIAGAGYRTVLSFRDDGEATARLSSESTTGPIDNHEFSDENGLYSSELEANAFRLAAIRFVHLPLVNGAANTWTKDTYNTYLPYLQAAQSSGAVLTHCASGYRSAAFSLTYIAQQSQQCSDWVLMKAKQVGFDYHSATASDTDKQVVSFIYDVLGC
jgi:protein tyrosine phosphatase (PTP) superfamily phosphohydrolase (DUF442 family)